MSLPQLELRVDNSSPKFRKDAINHKTIMNSNNNRLNNQPRKQSPSFGICFDIDGVIARGSVPISSAVRAFGRLVDDDGQFRVPVAFVTNSLNRNVDRARQLSAMLGVEVSSDQMILAPSPLIMFNDLHDKFCLVVGQGDILEIANDLGFKKVCTVEQIAEAYPLLDVADHDNRKKLASDGFVEKDFPQVEAVILFGEPKRWESALQLLVDVLRTGGRPNMATTLVGLDKQLPVVACNMDLQFMHQAKTPRYGHGAFLICLEALFKKITNYDLQYTALVGKPSEITFRYAEHVLTTQSRKLGFNEPLKTMYLIGDTPDSDIAGSNLYQQFVNRVWTKQRPDTNDNNHSQQTTYYDPDIPPCRNVPSTVRFHEPTIDRVEPILVCTGVYRPKSSSPTDSGSDPFSDGNASSDESEDNTSCDGDEDIKSAPFHGHRDFPHCSELYRPTRVCSDVDAAVHHILVRQAFE